MIRTMQWPVHALKSNLQRIVWETCSQSLHLRKLTCSKSLHLRFGQID